MSISKSKEKCFPLASSLFWTSVEVFIMTKINLVNKYDSYGLPNLVLITISNFLLSQNDQTSKFICAELIRIHVLLLFYVFLYFVEIFILSLNCCQWLVSRMTVIKAFQSSSTIMIELHLYFEVFSNKTQNEWMMNTNQNVAVNTIQYTRFHFQYS